MVDIATCVICAFDSGTGMDDSQDMTAASSATGLER